MDNEEKELAEKIRMEIFRRTEIDIPKTDPLYAILCGQRIVAEAILQKIKDSSINFKNDIQKLSTRYMIISMSTLIIGLFCGIGIGYFLR